MSRDNNQERYISLERYNKPFPTRLRALIERGPKTTQKALGEIVGRSRQAISQYCAGEAEPPYETLVLIAKHFDVSVDYLLGITDDPGKYPIAIDALHLDIRAIQWLNTMQQNYINGRSVDLNLLLLNSSFQLLVKQLCNYISAIAATQIAARIFPSINNIETADAQDVHTADNIFVERVKELVSNKAYNAQTLQTLQSMAHFRQLMWEESTPYIYNTIHDAREIAEFERLRIDQTYQTLLDEIVQQLGTEQNTCIPSNVQHRTNIMLSLVTDPNLQ